MNNHLSELLLQSSAVEGLEQVSEGKIEITFYPHRQFLPQDVKVVLEPGVYAKGTAPRFLNSGRDILLFANESHRRNFLSRCGFEENWIDNNLLPQKAKIIPFPENMPRRAKAV